MKTRLALILSLVMIAGSCQLLLDSGKLEKPQAEDGKCSGCEPPGVCVSGECCVPQTDVEYCSGATASWGQKCAAQGWTDRCEQKRTTACCVSPLVCGENGRCGCDLVNRPAPTEWAQWPLPPLSPPKEAYVKYEKDSSELDAVLDTHTCLIWQRTLPRDQNNNNNWKRFYTHKEVIRYCESLGEGWRLPTAVELGTIRDMQSFLAINKEVFGTTIPCCWYWTATPYVGNSDRYWGTCFGYGDTREIDEGETSGISGTPMYVRCVK